MRKTTPPITPPTIAPIFVLLDEEEDMVGEVLDDEIEVGTKGIDLVADLDAAA